MLNKILIFLALLLPFSLWSQTADVPSISYSGTPRQYEIANINVTGISNYEPSVLVNLSGLKVGQTITVPGTEISESIQKFWDQGLFSNVRILAEKIEGRQIYLLIELQERPRLTEINYFGLKKSEVEDISEKVNMMKGQQVTPYLVSRSEKYIKEHFVEKGFLNVDVKVFQRNDTSLVNHVFLDVTVDKKEKIKVKTIEIVSEQPLTAFGFDTYTLKDKEKETYFDDEATKFRIRWAMKKTAEMGRRVNFFKTKKFIDEEYRKDLGLIIDKYNEAGYRDARIVSESVTMNPDPDTIPRSAFSKSFDGKYHNGKNTVHIKIKIEEGRKYYLGDVKWIGNTIYPSALLSSQLKMKKGDVYNLKYLNKRLTEDEDAVMNAYMDNGYLFANCTPVEVNFIGDTINLEMRIYEGRQATINNVIIQGNNRTHEHVARREIRTKPGQLFSKSELIRTVRELAQLGYFDPEKIVPDVRPNPESGTVDLVYILEEKASDQVELSGGWGAGMFVGSLGLKFSNFSMRNIFNKEAYSPLPTGDGQSLSLRAQTNGSYYQNYSMSFVEPWLGGKRPNSLSVSTFYSIQSNASSSYYYNYSNTQFATDKHMNIFGGSIGFGKRLTWPDDFFQFYSELGYEHYDLKNWDYFIMNNGQSNSLHLKLMVSRNSLDNPLYTRNGSNLSVGVDFTPPYSMWNGIDYSNPELSDEVRYKWIEFHKWTFKGSLFRSLDKANKLVAMSKFEFGFLGYYDKDARSPFEKYVMGGDGMSGYSLYGSETIGLRGYENASLTPYTNGAQDGNMYNKFTFELRYPITLQPSATIYLLGFGEAGNCWSDYSTYNSFSLYRSAGVGARIFLPMLGLMGVDWGYGFDQVPGRVGANGSQFHFVIGQSF